MEGLWYKRKRKRFPASKIDRRFSYGNINKHLAANKPLHPKCDFLYADGSIRPLNRFRGVALTPQQTRDYVAGKSVQLEGCTGCSSTIYIRLDKASMKLQMSYQNLDKPQQSVSSSPSQSFSAGHNMSSPQVEEQGYASGGGLTWPEFRKMHPELSPQEALRRFRAIKRGQDPNANIGHGVHM